MHNAEVLENPVALDTLTPRYTEQAVRFLKDSKDAPFFLYLPHTYPHIPLAASARFRGSRHWDCYGDVVQEIDWSVGEILTALKRNGQRQNTLVMFSSDNGPWYQGSRESCAAGRTARMRAEFASRLSHGWPGRIPKGRVCHGLASMMTFFDGDEARGRGMPGKPAGWDRHVAAAERAEDGDRARGAVVFRSLGFAVRALEQLEAAFAAAQFGTLHGGSGGRAAEFRAAASGVGTI